MNTNQAFDLSTCLNCGAIVNENFCPRCGQKVEVKKLTWHSFIEEVFHFFTHIEKGFLNTTKELILHPGKLCQDYLEGRRKSYHKPVSFLLIWITIYLFVRFLSRELTNAEVATVSTLITWDPSILDVIAKYRTLIDVSLTPFMSFMFWIILARPKLNYVEVLSIYFYLYSVTFMIHVAHMIIITILNLHSFTNTNEYVSLIVIAGWVLYAGHDLFKRYAVSFIIPRLIIWIVVGLLIYMSVVRIIARILIAWGI